jgi:hypothetical protein
MSPSCSRYPHTCKARVNSCAREHRILYTIEGSEPAVTVVVRAVLHRSRAYRRS